MLLGVGLSLDDLMRIARGPLEASEALARDVIDAWSTLVGSRLRRGRRAGRAAGGRGGPDEDERPERVAASIRALAGIVGQLVAYRVERAVLDAARAQLEREGTEAERAALARAVGPVDEA